MYRIRYTSADISYKIFSVYFFPLTKCQFITANWRSRWQYKCNCAWGSECAQSSQQQVANYLIPVQHSVQFLTRTDTLQQPKLHSSTVACCNSGINRIVAGISLTFPIIFCLGGDIFTAIVIKIVNFDIWYSVMQYKLQAFLEGALSGKQSKRAQTDHIL